MVLATGPSLLTSWTFDPWQWVPILVVAFLYGRRVRTLAGRGTPVPGWRVAMFVLGLVLAFAALVSPIDAMGEEQFFFCHMTQHVLLGDLAPLCFLLGLTGPILRPVLALHPVDRLRV